MSPAGSRTRTVFITMQYRTKRGMTYELASGQAQLALHIFPGPDDATPGDWHVEARLGNDPGPSLVDGRGASAADALAEVIRAAAETPALARVDWDGVTRELRAVRGI
jgi:hypothetical protein